MDHVAYQAIPVDFNDYFAPSAPSFTGGGSGRDDGENRKKLYLIGGLVGVLALLLVIVVPILHHKHHHSEVMTMNGSHGQPILTWNLMTDSQQEEDFLMHEIQIENEFGLDENGVVFDDEDEDTEIFVEYEGESEEDHTEQEEDISDEEKFIDAYGIPNSKTAEASIGVDSNEENVESEDFYDDDHGFENTHSDDEVEEDTVEEYGN
jgi:hypothetical protein